MGTGEARLRLDSHPAELHRIGETLQPLCAALHMSSEECGRVELAVEEAVTNVIRHAYGSRPGNVVEIRIAALPHGLVIEVHDRGRPMPPDALAIARLPEAEDLRAGALREGGLGLAIVKTVMDEVEYRSEGGSNVLRLVKRVDGGG